MRDAMIVILTGGVGAGKTRSLCGILSALHSLGVPAAGFVSERVFMDGALAGYDLIGVAGGRGLPFLRRASGPGGDCVGPWRIDPAGLAAAAEIIRTSKPGALLIVDELGPLELEGRGHWPALTTVLDQPGRRFLFVIRDTCLTDFARLFAGHSVKIHSVRAAMDGRAIAEEIESDGREG